jgi:malate dehydrogenase (quinone)
MTTSIGADRKEIVLIGAGIMSATLGVLLKELEPSLSITIIEALADCAQESSNAWNNAGTGHAANCELNYTPPTLSGDIDIPKLWKSMLSLISRGSFGPILSKHKPSLIQETLSIPALI